MNNQMVEAEEPLSLSADIKRACELLEKLQKSKYCGEVPATKLAALQKVLQSDSSYILFYTDESGKP